LGLTGVLSIQGLWIYRAVRINAQAMKQEVSSALREVSRKLEEIESLRWVARSAGQDSIAMFRSQPGKPFQVRTDRVRPVRIVQQIVSEGIDSGMQQQLKVSIDSARSELLEIKLEANLISESEEEVRLSLQDSMLRSTEVRLLRLEMRREKVDSLLEEISADMDVRSLRLEDRLNDTLLIYLLGESFRRHGLPGDYLFAVVPPGDSVRPILSSPGFSTREGTVYESPLYSNDLITEPVLLKVAFPGRSQYLIRSMVPLLILSLLFALFLVVAAGAGILTMYRQKKLNQVKSDLINNISHELRTPLATISLATDTLADEQVIGDPPRIRHFLSVIRQENLRMQQHVERVLQMALLDRDALVMDLATANLNAMTEKVVQSMQLQATHRGGHISVDLGAEHPWGRVDQAHFHHIVLNLIDNALKYSPDIPRISLSTRNQGPWFELRIADEGIGMDKATRKKIFDPFYRAQGRDAHNVKGFGLGLSFVRAALMSMGGQVEVESNPGQGATFIVRLPWIEKEEEDETI